MSPQKTMAVTQQSQQTSSRSNQAGDQTAKPRKRKGKQPSNNNIKNNSIAPSNVDLAKSVKQQVTDTNSVTKIASTSEDKIIDENQPIASANVQTNAPASPSPQSPKVLVPAERNVINKNKQAIQVPKQSLQDAIVPSRQTNIVKQLSTDEADDIDAGIELDGSSNSGSSVKDITEDNNKSASVSPIMAQSNVENCSNTSTNQVPEFGSVEQITGSMCGNIGLSSKRANSSTTPSTTMQKLAANRQVIEADEQQLQQKLHDKQKKTSLKKSLDTSLDSTASGNRSSYSISSPQSPTLCKICELHVYQMERLMAEKAVYHKGCFRCHQCKVQLRVDNYASHEGHVYCKAHHRQIFQPQVKINNEDDVDIVAKSTTKEVDEYRQQVGRLSQLSFSFLQPKSEEIRKRQMIICENEPTELPKDVVRSDTKLDDGIEKLNLNLNNILEKFEKGTSNDDSQQQSSAGILIEKPSIDIKKTLMAFETNAIQSGQEDEPEVKPQPRVVKKLTNLNGFLKRQSSSRSADVSPLKNLPIKRSESLMMRLKKYESRISGEQVADEDSEDENSNGLDLAEKSTEPNNVRTVPKKLTSLKNRWENGDISRAYNADRENVNEVGHDSDKNNRSDNLNGNSPLAEKNEELIKVRQQLARKKSGESASIKNIYENAIKQAEQLNRATKLNPSDLSALNEFSTMEIQQQLLQNGNRKSQNSSTPTTPNKDYFHLNLSNKANKLKERFEQGLINNSSLDDSDASNSEDGPVLTKLEQIRQEKLEDLSVFAEGEIKAREARSMFQQIDRRLSAASIGSRNSLLSHAKM